MPSPKVLFVFLDGVGVGPDDPERNPFLRAHLPTLRRLLGGSVPTLRHPTPSGPQATAAALEACLGVEGAPQSGTGQTALLTGENAAKRFGRHFGPWTPVPLRPLLQERNVLARATERGLRAAFANAYPEAFMESRYGRRPAAPPLMAHALGLLNRHQRELARGEAVASEIVNDGWQTRLGFSDLPSPTAEEAGQNLVGIARGFDLTFYAHYSTDLVGHGGEMEEAVEALERVDGFLTGIVNTRPRDMWVVVGSDHGNIEDVTLDHTLNPAMGLVIGEEGAAFPHLTSLLDVAPFILGLLPE